MCSHYIPFKFPMGSHQVSNVFLNMFSIAPHFYPMCLGRCPPFTYIGGQKGEELYTSKENLLFWWASIVWIFLLSDGPIKLSRCKK
jgi:hypothetical protein